MAAFKKDEYDSDMSDEVLEEEPLSAWLDEEEPEEDPDERPKPVVVVSPKIDIVRKPKYIIDNLDLFYALCEVDDWGFVELADQQQEDIMKALTIRSYQPGENIIVEGDGGNDCYIVSATEETAHFAEVEVVTGNILEGTEVFLTRLNRGQYFGQKYFLTRRAQKRGATVRVPKDAKVAVNVAVLSPEHFDKWDSFRNLLLVKTVPMVQMLPRKERQKILQNLSIKDFRDGDYIIRQGDVGEDFFIIQEGSVKVVETRPSPEFGWEKPYDHTLVTLREGHFFGEMALVTNEPRVASVVSVSKLTICLVLAKKDFRAALSDETFGEVLSEVLAKRKTIRAQRESNSEESVTSPSSRDSLGGGSSNNSVSSTSRRNSSRKRTTTSSNSGEVSVSTTLSMRKLESGSRVINKYVVEKELGKGSFGEVYLCKDQETGEQFAMKMIARPQSSWNDDSASSIKQEIAVMKRLQHVNIVNLHEVIDDQNARKIFLIQEYMEGGPLMADAEECEPVDVILARKYFRDILRGVCYLHSEGIIHRDIKPQNMLLSADGIVKIADFGAAVFTTTDEKVAFGGTPAFMAPELFLTNSAIDFTKNEGIDVFALGATLYFMLTGKPPWMAKNQLDLATKIKNFELTFPPKMIDPHVKHLLRQMLAKDYRTRCTLDSIVIDDWVTFEGSEPLFDIADFSGTSFPEFLAFAANEEGSFEDTYHVLIMDRRVVNRTMLSQKINNIHHSVCACVENAEQVKEMMASARQYNTFSNFDYIFIETSPDNEGLEVIKDIRRQGFHGRIIAVNYSQQDFSTLVCPAAADAQVRFPIPVRDITKILSTDAFEEVNTLQRIDSHTSGVSDEDLDKAITAVTKAPSSDPMDDFADPDLDADIDADDMTNDDMTNDDMHSLSRQSMRSASVDDEDIDAHVHDFQQQVARDSRRSPANNMSSVSLDFNQGDAVEEYNDAQVLNLGTRNALSRKRGFTVVPYASSASPAQMMTLTSKLSPSKPSFLGSNSGSPRMLQTRADSDRELNIVPLSDRDDNRRKRREAAMNKSKLAHEYRLAKNNGDEKAMHSSKSLLNLLSKSKSKRASNKSPHSARSSAFELSQSTKDMNASMERFLDSNAQSVADDNSVADESPSGTSRPDGSGNAIGVTTPSSSFTRGLQPKIRPAKLEDSDDSDAGEILSDSEGEYDEHDDDDDDDDYGELDGDITQLDGSMLDDVFNEMVNSGEKSKHDEENNDLIEWNHIMIHKGLNHGSLVAPAEMTNLDLEIKIAKAETIGSRSYMEDRTYTSVREAGSLEGGCCPLSLSCVFDGHNGKYVSEMLQAKFASTFATLFRAAEMRVDFRGANYTAHVVSIFEEASMLIDAEILRADYIRQQHTIKTGIQDIQSFAGSAAVMMAVLPVVHNDLHYQNSMKFSSPRIRSSMYQEQMQNKVQVFVAHVGDCRAVLCNDGVAVQLTIDHKPSCKTEKARIEAAGGSVHNGRVNGLGVSRAFGDIQFKVFSEAPGYVDGQENLHSLWSANQPVISKPEIKHFIVESPFEFVILACDGLWDVFDCQEAVNFVRKRLAVTRNVDKTAQELIQKALKRGTQDNTSVVIVTFHQTEMALM
eukprot:gene9513-11190_t